MSLFCLITFSQVEAQYISVDTSLSDLDLVNKFVGTQSCVAVSNVKISGSTNGGSAPSYGYFTKNGSAFEMDEGIILSTGIAKAAEGPNTYRQDNGNSGWGGDPDLFDALGTGNYINATYLEFDFVSTESTSVSFQYMFLSEEYDVNKKSGCNYSDAFAFLIKPLAGTLPYTNIALVPGTMDPVSVINIRGYSPTSTCPPKNEDYFGAYNEQSNLSTSPTNFNGQTKILTAIANVQIGVPYHIKLVIADEGTTGHDSAVFLKTGSFVPNIDIGNDRTINNSNPLCENVPYRIQPNPPITDTSAQYSWFKDGITLPVPKNQTYYDVLNEEGVFSVNVVLGSGCKLEGSVTIEKAPLVQVSTTPLMVCDDDFNGSYSAKLSSFDSEIIRDYDPANFNRSYSLTPTGAAIDPNSDFIFNSNPQTLYVRVGAFSCSPKPYPIQFYFGAKLDFTATQEIDICDNDISGDQTFDLRDYTSLITNEIGVAALYFDTEAKAKIGDFLEALAFSQTISSDKIFYVRIEKPKSCPNYKKITFKFKQPKKSTSLKNEVICKGTKIDLDAGTGFQYYEWSNGVKGQFANEIKNVPAGDYSVKLTFNDCVYEQSIKVTEAELPVIDNVLIEGTTVTVLVSGGTKPYQYALDGGNYQNSNIFTNVELGMHIVYVKGDDGCAVIAQDFTLINSQNVITPNSDGVNDVINYSSLLQKIDPKFEIYDRFGVQVFNGDVSNQFIWNGTSNGRTLPTSSYWYILEWNEIGTPKRTQLSGWILLKNRNN
ncbi:choice-of-anchor L domain-containing protein [Epilithonimonas arachidiradicis]|uniref:choice-of-anchor L domain-containing protein n=1 Tax=Epilithonimonas arachidiradicis TaxID=1617282 RepID=UPI0014737C4F|nr:choice-of-anchor L domain-containing protein [Epilithonimonas arachidiradicis]